jgi:hypothetical protein
MMRCLLIPATAWFLAPKRELTGEEHSLVRHAYDAIELDTCVTWTGTELAIPTSIPPGEYYKPNW